MEGERKIGEVFEYNGVKLIVRKMSSWGRLVLMPISESRNALFDKWHKASVDELIEHFKQ